MKCNPSQILIMAIFMALCLSPVVSAITPGAPAQENPYIYVTQWNDIEDPTGIAINTADQVYVTSGDGNNVRMYNKNGDIQKMWGLSGKGNRMFDDPKGVAINSTGTVYVSDLGNHRVQFFSSTGTYLGQWGRLGSENGNFTSPYGIAVNNTGYVYVTDIDDNRVQIFTSTGTYLGKWGTTGDENGNFDTPRGIAINSTGVVYVTESKNDRVQYFTPDGKYLGKWGSSGDGNGKFNSPNGIAINATGCVFVSDPGNTQVQYFTPSGEYLGQWRGTGDLRLESASYSVMSGIGGFYPTGVAVNSTGAVLAENPDTFSIQTFFPPVNLTSVSPASGNNSGSVDVELRGVGFYSGVTVNLTRLGSSNITGSNVTITSPTKIGCSLPLTGAQAGAWNVVAKNTNGNISILSDGFTVQNQQPVISALNPNNEVINTHAVDFAVTVTGTGFVSGCTATLNGTSRAVSFTDSSHLDVTFLAADDDTPGSYPLVITNPAPQVGASDAVNYVVGDTVPTITAISPDSGYNSANIAATITGTGFRTGIVVTLANQTVQKTCTLTSPVTGTKLSCTLPVKGLSAGAWNLTVTNTDGTTDTKTNVFTVIGSGSAPTISKISPNWAYNTGSVSVIINGTQFRQGASVTLVKGSTTKKASIKTIMGSRITCTLPLTGVSKGQYNLTVTNKDGTSVTKKNIFTVKPAGTKPSISRISPSFAYNSGNTPVVITGKNFRSGLLVKLTKGPVKISGTIKNFTGSRINCILPLTRTVAGTYSVTVLNSDGTSFEKKKAFIIKAAGSYPTIKSISPKSGISGQNTIATISGTNFRDKVVVQMIKGSTIKKATITSRKPTKIVCTLPTKGMAAAVWDLKVTNTDGTSVTKSKAFKVTKGATTDGSSVTGSEREVVVSSASPVSYVSSTGNSLAGGVSVPVVRSGLVL